MSLAARRIRAFSISKVRRCSSGTCIGEKNSRDSDSRSKDYEKRRKSDSNHRFRGKSRYSDDSFGPNLKRSLQRMERSMEMCESDLPASIFDEILDEERRVEKQKLSAKLEERNKRRRLTLKLISQLKESSGLNECKAIHEEITKNEIGDPYLGNLLVHAYTRHGDFALAREAFAQIQPKNVFSYNLMIKACIQNGKNLLAKKLFAKMRKRNIEPDGFTVSTVVGAYAKSEHLKAVRRVFNRLENKEVPTWTAMISAYSQCGKWKKALRLLRRMELEGARPNALTIASAIEGCKILKVGTGMHERAVASGWSVDLILGTALLRMYIKCGKLDEARKIFDKMDRKPVTAWTVIISAYTQDGKPKESLKIFKRMQKGTVAPCNVTYVNALAACSRMRSLAEGKSIHAHIKGKPMEADTMVAEALFDMYLRCSSLENAKKVFEAMKSRDLEVWNRMLSAYAGKGFVKEAAELYQKMDAEKVKKDSTTYSAMLIACSDQRELQEGRAIYSRPTEAVVAEVLVNTYGKLGNLDDAMVMFSKMKKKYVGFWNTTMSVFARHGHGDKALELYHLMALEGVMANSITFTAVFLACGHSAALQEQSRDYFTSMVRDYNLKPGQKQFESMVDLLGSQGKLSEAEELITNTPLVKRDATAWRSLLSACKTHRDMDRAERAATRAFEFGQGETSAYEELSAMYTAADRLEDAQRIKQIIGEKLAASKTKCHDAVENVAD